MKKKSFFIGLVSGVMVMLVLCIITVLLVVRHYTGELGGKSGYVSSKDSVLDTKTAQKIEQIQGLFEKKSIYDINREDMQLGMIDGLLLGTGDKYAQYFTPEEITELMSDYGGKFYGIGAVLSLNANGFPEVQSVYADSPSDKAGLRSGDVITEVDGVDILGMTLDEIVAIVRGDKGTKVNLTVFREGENDYIHVTPIRDEIKVTVVEYEMKDDNIGYIHIEEWYDTTPDQFSKALVDLKKQGMEGLVIDLRSNTGGLLNAVVSTCREVLPSGLVVYTETVDGRSKTFDCDGKKEIDVPVAILTNGYTASASEIFTAAMKDHGKAISIGTKTYGKGVVQSFEYFSDGSAMKLTTEQYFTPNGTAIDGVGIEPDIEVAFDSEAYYDKENPFDNQLDAALEYIGTKI